MKYQPTGSSLKDDGHVSEWFGAIMFEAAEAAGIKISAQRVLIYARDLDDLAPSLVIAAVRRHRQESNFFPFIADIRRHVLGAVEDVALLAWSRFELAAQEIGGWASIDVEDGYAVEALLGTFGSWTHFCEMDGSALGAKRAEFLAAYRLARRRGGSVPAALLRLGGQLEQDGRYQRGRAVWVGRIGSAGVTMVRDVPALPAAPDVNRLTEGESENLHDG